MRRDELSSFIFPFWKRVSESYSLGVVLCVFLVGKYFRSRPETASVLDRKIFPVPFGRGMNFRLLRLQVEMVDVYTPLSLLLDGKEVLGLEFLEIGAH